VNQQRIPRTMLGCLSRSATCVRFLLNCATGTGVLVTCRSLTLGLATNRKDRLNASGFRLAPDSFRIVSARLATCRRGSSASTPRRKPSELASVRSFCRSENNCETCQGTSVFLLLLQQKSTIFSQIYPVCFQASAAHPQRYA
jgi:hypothetical protein